MWLEYLQIFSCENVSIKKKRYSRHSLMPFFWKQKYPYVVLAFIYKCKSVESEHKCECEFRLEFLLCGSFASVSAVVVYDVNTPRLLGLTWCHPSPT